MDDWFEAELGITAVADRYCRTCGEGDSDWCSECEVCTYCNRGCDCPPHCRTCGLGDGDWCDDCEQCAYCDGCDCTYCDDCGKGDSDWCYDCDGCRFNCCRTCTCIEYEEDDDE